MDARVRTRQDFPLGFFDGASQQAHCGGGGLLYFSPTHFFVLTSGLGSGTNNFAELMSLKLLIVFAIEKGCQRLKVYGDSLNVINWIKGTQRCLNIRLARLVEDIQRLQTNFDFFDCQHVYRENNKEADQRSKEGINMVMGQWKITEHHNEQSNEYWHSPFLEQTSSF
jgi:ribonuclease HI